MSFYTLLNAAVAKAAGYIKTESPNVVYPYAKDSTGEPTPLEATTDGLKVSPSLPSGAATETTLAAVLALETVPTIPTAITASDATDISALTTKGVLVGGDGTVIVRGTGAPSVSVTITALAGQYLPIQCSRIMAASTATGLVGLS